jgi:xanthine phosphoribosyltransferase
MTSPTKLFLSWEEIEAHTKALSEKLKAQGNWDKLVCITRGGLMPASLTSRYLDIKYVDTICLSSYDETDKQGQLEVIKEFHSTESNILVLDDLVDTGKSFFKVKEMLPNAHLACIYAKPNGIPFINSYQIDVPQTTWIVFPWEL